MASEFPGRPRLAKGALCVYETDQPATQADKVIPFQFNPDQLRRSFAARAAQETRQAQGGVQDVLRVAGPPVETLTLSIVLDAAELTDDSVVSEQGLNGHLAMLELLLYPSSARIQEIERRANDGDYTVSPAEVPLVLFSWGRHRAAPVMLTTFSITEELFDPNLNPIFARVDLGLRILTSFDFQPGGVAEARAAKGREAYVGYLKKKESLADRTRG